MVIGEAEVGLFALPRAMGTREKPSVTMERAILPLTGGNSPYTGALKILDGDMDQYIKEDNSFFK
jgi:hypothetical protein